jgi:hypothetical protein
MNSFEQSRWEPQLVKFRAFYGTRRFITTFTRARDLSSWARSIQSMPPSHFLNIHFYIIFPSTPGPSKWFLPSGLPTKTLYAPLLYPLLATRPAFLIISYFITRIIFDEEFRSLSSSLRSLRHYRVNYSLLGPNILRTTFSNTLSLRSSLSYTLKNTIKLYI